MGDTRTVPAVSTRELEEFFLDGQPALSAETNNNQAEGYYAPAPAIFRKIPSDTCCVGVDAPGMGLTHSLACPAMARTLPRSTEDVTQLPMRADQRSKLVGPLLFAARDLAESRLLPAKSAAGEKYLLCTECLMAESLGVIAHTESCKVGRVLGGLKALVDAPSNEEIPAGQTCAARGFGEPWFTCVDDYGDAMIKDVVTLYVASCRDTATASRIVDCVNSAAGMNFSGTVGASKGGAR